MSKIRHATESYVEDKIKNKIDATNIKAGTNVSVSVSGNDVTISSSGGSGGTSDYNGLMNLPQINGVEITGSKTLVELGIQPSGNYATNTQVTDLADEIGILNTERGYLKTRQITDVTQISGNGKYFSNTSIGQGISGTWVFDVTEYSTTKNWNAYGFSYTDMKPYNLNMLNGVLSKVQLATTEKIDILCTPSPSIIIDSKAVYKVNEQNFVRLVLYKGSGGFPVNTNYNACTFSTDFGSKRIPLSASSSLGGVTVSGAEAYILGNALYVNVKAASDFVFVNGVIL